MSGANSQIRTAEGRETSAWSAPVRSDARYRWALLAIIALMLLIHLVTLRPGHSWHDDFALYVLHARNIVQGIPYENTGFFYNSLDPHHSPRVYPPGFPLLLAPVYALFGLNLIALKLVVVAAAVTSVAVLAAIARDVMTPRLALVVAALYAFQPFLVRFKNLLLPDMVFVLFALLSLLLLCRLYSDGPERRSRVPLALLTGICMYAAISLRTVGVTIIVAIALFHVLRLRPIRWPTVICVGTTLLLYAGQLAWMPDAAGYVTQMSDVAVQSGGGSLQATLIQYAARIFSPREVIRLAGATDVLWVDQGELWAMRVGGAQRVVVSVFVYATGMLAVLGYCLRLRRATVLETFVPVYVLALLVWAFGGGARYLVPVMPLFIMYAVLGWDWLYRRKLPLLKGVLGSLAVAVAVLYTVNLTRVPTGFYANGVTGQESLELFAYIRSCTPADARFIMHRPRTLALYTGRVAASGGRALDDAESLRQFLDATDTRYVVTQPGLRYEQLTRPSPEYFENVFSNAQFGVYRYRTASSAPDLTGC